jgi:hypothetical protein
MERTYLCWSEDTEYVSTCAGVRKTLSMYLLVLMCERHCACIYVCWCARILESEGTVLVLLVFFIFHKCVVFEMGRLILGGIKKAQCSSNNEITGLPSLDCN